MESSKTGSGGRRRVLLGLTGSIGIVKAPAIVSLLREDDCLVRVVMTAAAAHLGSPAAFAALTGEPVGLELMDEPEATEIRHVAWANWADAILVAPASASSLGKMAAGIADNLLTTLLLAATCPVMVVPAMNSNMYQHAAVQENMRKLRERGVHVMEAAEGRLACGITGPGRLPEPEEIVACFLELLPAKGSIRRLNGRRILVTAGPTVEDLDPVRFISNRSSGRMGYALAAAAHEMGADVTLISGPVAIDPPVGIEVIKVRSARDMQKAVMDRAQHQDAIVACAAVADYQPEQVLDRKAPKKAKMTLSLVQTPDILAELGQNKSFYLVGFAAQTEDAVEQGREKLRKKNLDMIVVNNVARTDIGMDSEYNEVEILRPDRDDRHLTRAEKRQIAQQIMLEIASELDAHDGS